MYSQFKKIIIVITVAVIAMMGIIFINAHKSDIFGGYREVIVVDKSTVDFPQVLNDYVKKHHLVMAKRIVESSHDGSGSLKNTYVPIGDNKLPDAFPIQHDPILMKNSPANTLYVIVSNHMSASQVAQDLSKTHNMVRVLPTNYELSLVYYLLKIPQSLLIVLGVLVAYISIVLTEYISNMKEVGIRRISGEGKHSIALKQTYKDSLFILITIITATVAVSSILLFMNNWSSLTFLIVILPVILWCLLILILNFSLAHMFYYILQHQPIILSIKGKAPVKLIFLVIIITQIITLASVMYCVSGMMSINKDLDELNSGKYEWQKFSGFFEITSLDDRESVSKQQKIDFLKELNDKTTIIYREDTLDNITTSKIDNKVEYSPTPENISNVIYVNGTYIKYSDLTLSKDVMTFIQQMHDYDKLILIPQSQKNNFVQLSQQWESFLERGFLPKDAQFKNLHPEAVIKTEIYQGGHLFTYPVYSLTGRLFSNTTFLNDPIIVVKKLDYTTMLTTSNLLIDNPKVVLELIKKHQVTAAYGSLTNGLSSIKSRIQDIVIKKYLLLISTISSITSSLLLFIIMNKIYFYQGRKIHFIERLSGKSLLNIHKIYLIVISISYMSMSIVALILEASTSVLIVPFVYLLILFIIFFGQLSREKNANILYLKGE